jgi:hypothetical protein
MANVWYPFHYYYVRFQLLGNPKLSQSARRSRLFEKLSSARHNAKLRKIAWLSSLPLFHRLFEMLKDTIVGLPDSDRDSKRLELAALILQGVDAKRDNRT